MQIEIIELVITFNASGSVINWNNLISLQMDLPDLSFRFRHLFRFP